MNILDKYKNNNNTLHLTEIQNDDFPHNYTPTMIRLKNQRFDGYDPAVELKGFCPFEPLVRIEQLLNFPIEQFNDGKWPLNYDIVFIENPPSLNENLSHTPTIKDILYLEPELKKWEDYYDAICKQISEILL